MSAAQLINNLHLCSKRNGKVFRKLSFYKSQYLFNQLLLQVQHSLSLQLFMALSLISFINRKHVHNTPTIWKPFKMWCSQSGEMKIQALAITSTAIHTRICLHFLVKAGDSDRYCQQIKSAADITKSTDPILLWTLPVLRYRYMLVNINWWRHEQPHRDLWHHQFA